MLQVIDRNCKRTHRPKHEDSLLDELRQLILSKIILAKVPQMLFCLDATRRALPLWTYASRIGMVFLSLPKICVVHEAALGLVNLQETQGAR